MHLEPGCERGKVLANVGGNIHGGKGSKFEVQTMTRRCLGQRGRGRLRAQIATSKRGDPSTCYFRCRRPSFSALSRHLDTNEPISVIARKKGTRTGRGREERGIRVRSTIVVHKW